MAKRMSIGDRVFEVIVTAIVLFLGFVCLYPLIYVFSCSISNPTAFMQGKVKLFPVGFSFESYMMVLRAQAIWTYYYNTVWYTVVGTICNILATILLAYPLSKRYFVLRGPITVLIIITMFFGGGLIPTFIMINNLGLYGSRWVMVLLGLVSTYNTIIARTFFMSLPEELFESARIEGASEFKVLWKIVAPLSKPILAVLTLYYGVGHWNTYLSALIYLPSSDLHPIQVLLRRVVLQNSRDILESADIDPDAQIASNQVKYAAIFFTMVPIMCLYPFLQKYFVKGVMIGALKG
ncbi:MAG: carbohydrate ABC transporter permease [Clostridiales bacterium]|nr:carbohydrate ABC transporter permease [Clostridiales bacterium]